MASEKRRIGFLIAGSAIGGAVGSGRKAAGKVDGGAIANSTAGDDGEAGGFGVGAAAPDAEFVASAAGCGAVAESSGLPLASLAARVTTAPLPMMRLPPSDAPF